MSERNGPDIAAVYQLLREVAQMVAEHGRRFDAIDGRFDAIDRRFDQVNGRLAEHDNRLDQQDGKLNEVILKVNDNTRALAEVIATLNRHEKKLDDLAAGQNSLQETLNFYHSAGVGHGIAITDLDERVKRLEKFMEEIAAGR
jgi:chromosome segregation ATPase